MKTTLQNVLAVLFIGGALLLSSTQYGQAAPSQTGAQVNTVVKQPHPKYAAILDPCVRARQVNCLGFDQGDQTKPAMIRLMPGPKGKRIVCVIHVYAKDSRLDYCS